MATRRRSRASEREKHISQSATHSHQIADTLLEVVGESREGVFRAWNPSSHPGPRVPFQAIREKVRLDSLHAYHLKVGSLITSLDQPLSRPCVCPKLTKDVSDYFAMVGRRSEIVEHYTRYDAHIPLYGQALHTPTSLAGPGLRKSLGARRISSVEKVEDLISDACRHAILNEWLRQRLTADDAIYMIVEQVPTKDVINQLGRADRSANLREVASIPGLISALYCRRIDSALKSRGDVFGLWNGVRLISQGRDQEPSVIKQGPSRRTDKEETAGITTREHQFERCDVDDVRSDINDDNSPAAITNESASKERSFSQLEAETIQERESAFLERTYSPDELDRATTTRPSSKVPRPGINSELAYSQKSEAGQSDHIAGDVAASGSTTMKVITSDFSGIISAGTDDELVKAASTQLEVARAEPTGADGVPWLTNNSTPRTQATYAEQNLETAETKSSADVLETLQQRISLELTLGKHARDAARASLFHDLFGWVSLFYDFSGWVSTRIRDCLGTFVNDIAEFFGPEIMPLRPGGTRLIWRCACGSMLFADFSGENKASPELLKQELLDAGYAACVVTSDSESGGPSHTHRATEVSSSSVEPSNNNDATISSAESSTNTGGSPPSELETSEHQEPSVCSAASAQRCWILSCLPFFEEVPEAEFIAVHVPARSPDFKDRTLFDLLHEKYTHRRQWYHRTLLCLDVVRISLAKFRVCDNPFAGEAATTDLESPDARLGSCQLAYVDREDWAPPRRYDLSGWNPAPSRRRPLINELHLLTMWRWRCASHGRQGDWLHKLAGFTLTHLQPLRLSLKCWVRRSWPKNTVNQRDPDEEPTTMGLRMVEIPSNHSRQVAVTLEQPTTRDANAITKVLPKKVRDRLVVEDPSDPPWGWGVVIEEGFRVPALWRTLYTIAMIVCLWAGPLFGLACVCLLPKYGLSIFEVYTAVIGTATLLLAAGKYFGITGK